MDKTVLWEAAAVIETEDTAREMDARFAAQAAERGLAIFETRDAAVNGKRVRTYLACALNSKEGA